MMLDVYTDFCIDKFEQAGKHLAPEVVSSLYQRFDAVASYMHRILKGLLDKDFITLDKIAYSVYDQFFSLWLTFKGMI